MILKMQLGPEILSSYKRLAYETWYALAEFVDNSTQAYFNNKVALDPVYETTGKVLTVEITAGEDGKGKFIRIEDNSIGMSEAELKNALHIGKPPKDTTGRSRYGLGLKTGASWFGDLWTVETKKLNGEFVHKIEVNVPYAAEGHLNLPYTRSNCPRAEHFTKIEIRKLHRTMSGRALGKAKQHLRSLYRRDISKGRLVLIVNGERLSWDSDIGSRLYTKRDGSKAKETFRFKVGGKTVTGWAGVLDPGSRREAGFSIIQADRVIRGWPDSYRPYTIFGEQETNDLVNQRIIGEIVLDDFEVSHTKDQVLFDDGEMEELEKKLADKTSDLRQLAKSYRSRDERIAAATDDQKNAALNAVEHQLISAEMRDVIEEVDSLPLPSVSTIQMTNQSVMNAVVKEEVPNLKAKIAQIEVSLYLASNLSPNDPYVLIESTRSQSKVLVIINMAHPHWAQLTKDESIRNFIRHCTYDGVAESKAYARTGKLEADTIKLIKDKLLRVPMSVKRP
jgi:hypothetical protein